LAAELRKILKPCRKKLCQAQSLKSGFRSLYIFFWFEWLLSFEHINMMTRSFLVMAISAFCDFIRLSSVLNFCPRNDFWNGLPPTIFQQVSAEDICSHVISFGTLSFLQFLRFLALTLPILPDGLPFGKRSCHYRFRQE